MNETSFFNLKFYGIVFLIVLLASVLFGSVYIVNAGERAVILTFGNPSDVAIAEGLHFKFPIAQKAVIMDVKTQKSEVDLTAASRDLQDVNTRVAINYRLVPESAPEIYQTIGLGYPEKVIAPLEQEINKEVTAKYTAEELITKREAVRQEMKNKLYEKLLERGIIVEEVSIIDFKFSQSFADAIEAKATADQQRLKASIDLDRVDLEAQAIKLQVQQITPEYLRFKELEIQQKAIEKWDGRLPQVTGGSIPLVALNQS